MTTLQTPLALATTATASATLVAGKHTPCDATSGALTMTLPTPATIGARIRVEKVDTSANAVSITGTIRGTGSSTVTLTSQFESLEFFAESLTSWRPAAGHRTKAAMDAAYAAFGSTGGAGLPSTVVNRTTAYTAAAGDFVQADVTTAGYTVTLPASPAVGALVAVKKVDATANTLTIVPSGGGTIDGDANATTTTKMAGAIFEHVGSNVWRIVASMTTTGPAGPTGATGPTGPTGATGATGTAGAISLIQDEGSALTVRPTVNFVGAGVTATDDAANTRTVVTIPGGGGSSSPSFSLSTYLGLGHRSGRWYDGGINATARFNTTPSTNFLYVHPFYVPNAKTLDRLGLLVNTGQAGGLARLGIYSSDASGLPNTLVVDAGEVDVSTSGAKEIVISQAVAADTLLWLAITVNIASVAMQGLPVGAFPSLGFAANTDASPPGRGYKSFAYGTLPTTFGTTTFDATPTAVVRVRIV